MSNFCLLVVDLIFLSPQFPIDGNAEHFKLKGTSRPSLGSFLSEFKNPILTEILHSPDRNPTNKSNF